MTGRQRPTVVLNARTARIGGARNFVEELWPRLAALLELRDRRVVLFSGPPSHSGERAMRRVELSRSAAILHAGNRATVGTKARQIVCVRDRLLVERRHLRSRGDVRLAVRTALMLHALRRADMVVVPSQSMVERLQRFNGHPGIGRFQTVVVPHGRPLWKTPPERPLGNPTRFLYPSFVAAHKNFELLAGVFGSLRRRGIDNVRLTLTTNRGDRLQKRTLQDLFAHASPLVDFVGAVSRADLPTLYGHHDALLFPSRFESFGLPLLEAMVMGMPIVATDEEWAREICGAAARYAPPEDALAWTEQIDALLEDGTRGNAAGVERAQAFDWDRSAEQYAALLI